jgi:N-acetylneuraminate synthase
MSGMPVIEFQFNGRKVEIGFGRPTFVIAEAACNHMCKMHLAHGMIVQASMAKVDAIKFQTYKAEKLVSKSAMTYWEGKPISQMEYYKKLDKFGKGEYKELFDAAKDLDMIGMSTPFDIKSAEMLNDLGMPIFKIASCCITDFELLEVVAQMGKPIFLSVGGADYFEIDDALDRLESAGANQIALLFCTFGYPTEYEDARLGRLAEFIENLSKYYVIGFSDHTRPDRNMIVPSLGVAMGANIVEKHFTLDQSATGSGHFFSVNPGQLWEMVYNIRLTEKVVPVAWEWYTVLPHEEETAKASRKKLIAAEDIPKGKKVGLDRVDIKRGPVGEHPAEVDDIADATPNIDIQTEEGLTWDKMKDPKY